MTPQGRIDAITCILFAGIVLGMLLTLAGCMPGVPVLDTGY